MLLFLLLFLFGAGVGTWLRYPYLIVALLAFVAADLLGFWFQSNPISLWELFVGAVALQAGYLAGVLLVAVRRRRKGGT